MIAFALIIKHQTQPGQREEVPKVWERYIAPAIAANPDHTAYFSCFDNYAANLKDVEPLLAGPPKVTELTPVRSKKTAP